MKKRILSILMCIALAVTVLYNPLLVEKASAATGFDYATYSVHVDNFLKDSRWKHGVSYGAIAPKLSTYPSSGCCAYCADFCQYVYGTQSWHNQYFTQFGNVSEIRSGDIIQISGHWFVVLSRNGNTLKTAEGNVDPCHDKYVHGDTHVSTQHYSISNGSLYNLWTNKYVSFVTGYHYNFNGNIPSDGGEQAGYVNLGDKFNASIFRKDHNVTFLSDTATLGTGGRHARSVWTFERQSNGAYIIASMYDGKVLDVYDAGKTDGTKVWTYAKWADSSGHNPAQEWYIYANAAADGGGYRFVPRVAPNKCMTCNHDSYGPNTGMNLQAYVKRASQTFTIYKQTEIFPTGISTSNVTVKAGETAKVPYTISPSNTNSKYVGATFSSSDTSVVTVASDGTITGVNPGTAYITVTMSFNERKSAKSKITVEAAQCGHSWDDGVVTQEPTCIDRGVIEYTCQLCGETTYETIDVTMHAYGDYDVVTKAGFGEEGVMAAVCTVEGCDSTIEQVIPALEKPVLSKTAYTFNGKSKKPTVTVTNTEGDSVSKTVSYASGRTNAGKYAVKVTVDTESYEDTATVYFKINPAKITKATLSTSSYTYNGKAKKPTVTVKAGTLSPATKISGDTTKIDLTYASGRKLVGTYKVTVKGKGNYTGTITKTFKINPVKTYITSLTAGNNKFTVKLKKKTTQVTGYQVRYSTSSKFSSYTTKTISSNKTVSKTYTGLKDKKTYYVKVRTYKNVNGTPYYSGWSAVKKIKTK